MAPTSSPQRSQVLALVADRILSRACPHPLRVAIDGIDAAGKTTLAGELEIALREQDRPVIRASLDGFHRLKAERYRAGPDSPEGYYHDSFDMEAVLDCLLLPLGPGGDRRYRLAAFDYRRDVPLSEAWQAASEDAVLLFDGIFLFRPELNPYWDFRIFLHISFETSIERGCRRDLAPGQPGGLEALRRRYRQRYIPAQQIYLHSVRPETLADIVLDNNYLEHPVLLKS